MDQNISHSTARAQARDWFARLQGTACTAAERMEFQRWRAVPGHAEALESTERLWQSFDGLEQHPDIAQLTQQVLARTAAQTTPDTGVTSADRRRFSWPAAIAAAIGVCAIGLAAYSVLRDSAPELTYTTEAGERSTIHLSDGSRLILNAATEVRVRIDDKDRRFTLSKGEALFDVARDPSRPFAVSVGDSEVVALGTRFQIRNEIQHITVTLLDGSIALDRPGVQTSAEALILKNPGQQVRFAPQNPQMTQLTVDPEVAGSWSTGWLRFRHTPLVDVLAEVNRYAPVPIRIAGHDIDPATPISGTFELGDSSSVVSALEALLSVKAVRRGEALVLQQY